MSSSTLRAPILVPQVGKARRAELLQILKRSGRGMTVHELAEQIGLTPTGTKPICLALEKAGYLTSHRQPRPRGRPALEYRLTQRAEGLFLSPPASPLLAVLQTAARLYGPTAPGKLLLGYFQHQEQLIAPRLRGQSPAERLQELARWRDTEGHFAIFEPGPPPAIVENHHPMAAVAEAFPEFRRLEEQMLSRLAGIPLRCEENPLDGSTRRRFIAQR